MLGEFVTDKSSKIAEFRRRNRRFMSKTVEASQEANYLAEGWEFVRHNKTGAKFQKLKPVSELLENDLWSVLYHFGYKTLSCGHNFIVESERESGKLFQKRLSVVAIDDETMVIAECKAIESRKKISMASSLNSFSSDRKIICRALEDILRHQVYQKVIWVIATRNVEWSREDKELAKSLNIRVISELEMRYFSEVAKRIGPAGRFQFHAEYLSKAKVPALKDVTVPAVKTKIGGNVAFFFIAPPRKLLPIAFVNHRDLRDPEAAPSYQRLITRSRLQSIAKFIQSDGYFANALLINFKESVRFDRAAVETEDGTTLGTLTLPGTYKSAWIIDGQHRLYAYAECGEDDVRHRIPVIAFENLPQDEEGRLFKTINSEQKRVSPNLLDELKGEQELYSADKKRQIRAIASRIIEFMRSEIGGPFEDRFKSAELPGSAERPLTMTSICNAIVNSCLLGKIKIGSEERFIQGPLSRETPVRTIDAAVSAFASYFSYIREANEQLWRIGKVGNLCCNIAVEAYIRLFGELCKYMHIKEGVDPREIDESDLVECVRKYLEPALVFVRTTPRDVFEDYFRVPPGSGGPARYFYKLSLIIRKDFHDFNPSGLDDFLRETAVTRTEKADRQIRIIQAKVLEYIVEKLKALYPYFDPPDEFLRRAVKNKEILKSAHGKRADVEGEAGPVETYIDFIDFRKIIETPENWPHFREGLSIFLPTERKGQGKGVKWFDEVNRLRRVPAHPYGKEYKDQDVELLDHVYDQLMENGIVQEDV